MLHHCCPMVTTHGNALPSAIGNPNPVPYPRIQNVMFVSYRYLFDFFDSNQTGKGVMVQPRVTFCHSLSNSTTYQVGSLATSTWRCSHFCNATQLDAKKRHLLQKITITLLGGCVRVSECVSLSQFHRSFFVTLRVTNKNSIPWQLVDSIIILN